MRISLFLRNCFVALAFVPALPAVALAQERDRKWVFGAEVGVTHGLHESFSDQRWWISTDAPIRGPDARCRATVVESLGVTVGRKLARSFRLDGMLALQAGPGSDCVDTLLEPINVVEATYIGETIGIDYLSTHLRAMFEPGNSNVRPRAILGLGWIPAKHIPSLAFGAGMSAGKSGTRFVSELGAQVPRVKWTREFRCYGNCGTRTGMHWIERGSTTPLQIYGRVGVEF